jgi:DNA-binding Lrp family transcriptional regulator
LARFLASVNIFVDASEKENIVQALSKLENIEELYEVAGEFDFVSIVSASNIDEFYAFLRSKIMSLKGVKSTISTVVLAPHKGPKMLKCPGIKR